MPGDSGWRSPEQVHSRMTTLMQRLHEEPDVAAVTFADEIPGAEGIGVLQSETAPAIISSRVNVVATNLFDVFDVRILAGRGFTAADANPQSPAVIVDQAFAERLAEFLLCPGGAELQCDMVRLGESRPCFAAAVAAPASTGPPHGAQ